MNLELSQPYQGWWEITGIDTACNTYKWHHFEVCTVKKGAFVKCLAFNKYKCVCVRISALS